MSSTSDIAKAALIDDSQDPKLPMLVLCEHQTAGRGQPGRQWYADSKSLTFTWCVNAELISFERAGLLPLVVGAAICETLKQLGIKSPRLKWPNDVLVNGKKVCGILVERIKTKSGDRLLIGVGINVNQDRLPDQDSTFSAASLKQFGNEDVDMQDLLRRSLERISDSWKLLLDPKVSAANLVLKCNSWFAFFGQQIEFQPAGGESTVGIFQGVDLQGNLQIFARNRLQSFASGQIVKVEP